MNWLRSVQRVFIVLAVASAWLFLLLALAHALAARGLLGPLGTPAGFTGIASLALLGALGAAALAACAVLVAAMWQRQFERSHQALGVHPLRCWLAGLLLLLIEIWLALEVVPPVPPAARGFLILVAVATNLILLAQGFPALAATAGERVHRAARPARGAYPSRAVSTALGSVLVAFSAALPILGWLLAGSLLLQAMGAAVLPLVQTLDRPPRGTALGVANVAHAWIPSMQVDSIPPEAAQPLLSQTLPSSWPHTSPLGAP